MDFPAYVPAAVRASIAERINGGSPWPIGLTEQLASAERQLVEIDRAIETETRRGEVEHLNHLRKQRLDAVALQVELIGDLDCLRRLAHDHRMKAAYARLSGEFDDDGQWRNFVDSARLARRDFSQNRERKKRAEELRVEIADAAKGLAELIRQIARTNMEMPAEFFSIPELLRQTGDPAGEISVLLTAHKRTAALYPRRGDRVVILPNDEIPNTLSDAWEAAPHLPDLLDTLADAAKGFKPRHRGMAAVATESRQRNPKTEYLRAFGFLATVHRYPNWQISLTTPVMQAMAIAANVAINLPDVDVTYDDVRKAFSNLRELLVKEAHPSCCSMLREEWLENSGEK